MIVKISFINILFLADKPFLHCRKHFQQYILSIAMIYSSTVFVQMMVFKELKRPQMLALSINNIHIQVMYDKEGIIE